ncbi:potassium transporter TrkG [Holospora curviuscula]|uniref:Trk system potassium uptake protein TrkH n=1 Tax=Holospora curviuscula TaxID=1082868 RepID=A0A2S5R7U0_9PROT|nr:potassium transporter TrkG [Holospora curviuscula]PPE03370.1 Trk system potassium uptake protein TrkH [Holospora curviuscula]
MRRYFKSVLSTIEQILAYQIPWKNYEKSLWVISSISWMLILLSACFFLIFTFFYFYNQKEILEIFPVCGSGCLFLGGLGVLAFPSPRLSGICAGEKALTTLFIWGIVAVIISIPIYVHSPKKEFSAALFEGVSCLTTTGISLISEKAPLPAMIEFWRVFVQWMGGIGIVLLSFTLIPALKLNSNLIVFSEFSQRLQKTTPRTQTVAMHIISLYLGVTLVLTLLLWMAGALPFQTCLHYSMSCISTGGIQSYHYPLTTLSLYEKIILISGMILGALPFLGLLQGIFCPKTFFKDTQIRGYFILCGISVFVISTHRHLTFDYLFNVISCITSTGFPCATALNSISSLWCLFLILLGGCSGSSAGGFKLFRIQLLYYISKNKILKTFRPKHLASVYYNGEPVQQEDVALLLTSVFLYGAGYIGVTFAFSVLGYTPKIACLLSCGLITNSGGAAHSISTYIENFSFIEQWISICSMLLGRLEAVMILGILSIVFKIRRGMQFI